MKTLTLDDAEALRLAQWIDGNLEAVREDAYYGDEYSQQTAAFLDGVIVGLGGSPSE